MKKRLVLALVLIVCVMLSACSEQEKTQDEAPVESINYLDYTYKEVSAEAFMQEVASNPLKAEKDYLNNYVTFSGYIAETTHINQSLSGEATITRKTYDAPETMKNNCFILYERVDGDSFMCTLHPSLSNCVMSRERMTVWGKVTAMPAKDRDYCSVEVLHYEFEEVVGKDNISYKEYTANDLIDFDAKAAEKELYNEFVSITAPVYEITVDGIKFGKTVGDGITLSYGDIKCPFASDEQKDIMAEKELGDTVTVKGRIVYINSYLSMRYVVEVFEIE